MGLAEWNRRTASSAFCHSSISGLLGVRAASGQIFAPAIETNAVTPFLTTFVSLRPVPAVFKAGLLRGEGWADWA